MDTTKKLKKAPKEWQELVICDRESHERVGETRIIHGGLEDVGIGELADFGGNLVPRSGQQGDETIEPVSSRWG